MQTREKFPFFRNNNYIYFDSAATTQVPATVIQGVNQSLEYRGNPGRSGHALATRSEKLLQNAKGSVARFINAESEEIVFTRNTTDSLHIAMDSILGSIREGDEILTSVTEHHSNLLPLTKGLARGAKIKLISLQKNGMVTAFHVKTHLTPKTKIVALNHCSNVLGSINDIEEISEMLKKFNANIIFIVDGAQAVAHIPVDVKKIQADFYAFSGHKMYGPDGIGVLYVNKNMHRLLAPVRAGGGSVENITLTSSTQNKGLSPDYKTTLSTLEGGTPNTANAVGLSKAIGFIYSIGGMHAIREHETTLTKRLLDGLKKCGGVTIYGSTETNKKIGVVSFALLNGKNKNLTKHLTKRKICVRYGSHCAFPLAEALGTETIRVSLGVYNTEEDVDLLLKEILAFIAIQSDTTQHQHMEYYKKRMYTTETNFVNNTEKILSRIRKEIADKTETEVVVMGGHFLGIPDALENKFYPSIRGVLPERLAPLLEEFGMTDFPLFTLDVATDIVKNLKQEGIKAKLMIVANDTTGINELRNSPSNTEVKTADTYRQELLSLFKGAENLPCQYSVLLKQKGLSHNDVLAYKKNEYYFRETTTRANFKNFIDKNKDYFKGLIEYTATEGKIDLAIHVLENQETKTCTFNTFKSKTGGKFCIVEVTQIAAELFGCNAKYPFAYLNTRVKNPLCTAKNKILVMLTPTMCNSAVNNAGELYTKLFREEKPDGRFSFINIPFGPEAKRNLSDGVAMTTLSHG